MREGTIEKYLDSVGAGILEVKELKIEGVLILLPIMNRNDKQDGRSLLKDSDAVYGVGGVQVAVSCIEGYSKSLLPFNAERYKEAPLQDEP